MTFTRILTEFGRTICFENIRAPVITATRRLLLDTIGCAVAGYDLPSSRIITRVKGAQGGMPQATVFVGGQRLPSASVAYINSHLSNAIDADDTLNYKAHIAASTVAPALAVAEQVGASGRDVLAAIAAGYEVAGRVAMSLRGLVIDESGNLCFAQTTGYSYCAFASAVCAGRLLDLNSEEMLNAFGIAAATLPVPSATKFGLELPRPMTKYAMYGTIGEVGVTAALLAKEGFTGERSVLDGDKGFWRVAGSLDCNWDILIERLGERWLIEEVSYKPYPACRFLNAAIDMFYDLCRQHSLGVEEIERVELGIHGAALSRNMGNSSVESLVDTCFSAPYLLAAAALAGPPGPQWHTFEALGNEKMRAFASRVSVGLEPSASAAATDDLRTRGHCARMPSSIRIYARGEVYQAQSQYAKGDTFVRETVLTDKELEDKFRNFCVAQLGEAQTESAIEIVRFFEHESSVARLINHLVATSPSAHMSSHEHRYSRD